MPEPAKNISQDLLVLHPTDNIAVLKRPVAGASRHIISGLEFAVSTTLTMGHKVAIRPISKGDDVLKYGASIGYATCDILPGDHVHLHNLASRYTAVEDMETDQHA